MPTSKALTEISFVIVVEPLVTSAVNGTLRIKVVVSRIEVTIPRYLMEEITIESPTETLPVEMVRVLLKYLPVEFLVITLVDLATAVKDGVTELFKELRASTLV